jgi:hypothetical protein
MPRGDATNYACGRRQLGVPDRLEPDTDEDDGLTHERRQFASLCLVARKLAQTGFSEYGDHASGIDLTIRVGARSTPAVAKVLREGQVTVNAIKTLIPDDAHRVTHLIQRCSRVRDAPFKGHNPSYLLVGPLLRLNRAWTGLA